MDNTHARLSAIIEHAIDVIDWVLDEIEAHVAAEGFEPTQAEPSVLQTGLVDHLSTPPWGD